MGGEAGAHDNNSQKGENLKRGKRRKNNAGSERVEKEKGDARSRTDLFPFMPK